MSASWPFIRLLNELRLDLIPPPGTGVSTVRLFVNKTDAAGNNFPVGISGANLGVDSMNRGLGTYFDQEAAQSITGNTGGDASIGHFRPDSFLPGLTAFNGLSSAALNGAWTLRFTDFRNSGAAAPTQFLSEGSLIFASPIVNLTSGVPFSGLVAAWATTNPMDTPSTFGGTINWGDGTTSTINSVTVTRSCGVFAVGGTHTYAFGGAYPVTITLTGDSGATAATTATVSGPTAVRLRSLTSTSTARRTIVRWRTASELETLGFNVYGGRTKLNLRLIGAKGNGGAGASYRFVDRATRSPRAHTYHRLQAVDLDGSRHWLATAVPR